MFPLLATYLIGAYGFRNALLLEGVLWAVITFPMLLLFFRGSRDTGARNQKTTAPELTGVSAREGLRSSVSLRFPREHALHLHDHRAGRALRTYPERSRRRAHGRRWRRIARRVVLERRPPAYRPLARSLPRSAGRSGRIPLADPRCALLLLAGSNRPAQMVAAAIVGLTLGSEVDVIVYLTTRHFGLEHFGTIYGGLLTALSIGTAFGPLAAAAVHDRTGTYEPFLLLTIVCMAAASLALASLPLPVFAAAQSARPPQTPNPATRSASPRCARRR